MTRDRALLLERRSVLGLFAAYATTGCLPDAESAPPSREAVDSPSAPATLMGGGNLENNDTELTDRRGAICREFGARTVRLTVFPPFYFSDYWGKTYEDRIEENVLRMYEEGVEPTILFEYYDRYKNPLGKYEKWYDIGEAFAEKYRPGSAFLRNEGIRDWGITQYTAINEPEIRDRIEKWRYRNAIEGLADGVHSVDDSLEVYPGGWAMPSAYDDYTRKGYATAVADLLDDGTLDGFCLHIYFDKEYAPMDGTYEHSAQRNFERVKETLGLSSDPNFYCDEFNYVLRLVSNERAAKGFLTAIWDVLGVVKNDGETAATRLALPYNVFETLSSNREFGLLRRQEPFVPGLRGKVLERVLRLTRGMELVERSPDSGEFKLQGGSRTMWVWQNRQAWTDEPGTKYELDPVPPEASRVDVYGYDGLRTSARIRGEGQHTVTGLEPEQTYMFVLR